MLSVDGAHLFRGPWLMFIDSLRSVLIVLLFAVATSLLYLLVASAKMRANRLWALAALAGMATMVVFAETEFDRLGHPIGPGGRLWWIAAAGILWAAFAVGSFRMARTLEGTLFRQFSTDDEVRRRVREELRRLGIPFDPGTGRPLDEGPA